MKDKNLLFAKESIENPQSLKYYSSPDTTDIPHPNRQIWSSHSTLSIRKIKYLFKNIF